MVGESSLTPSRLLWAFTETQRSELVKYHFYIDNNNNNSQTYLWNVRIEPLPVAWIEWNIPQVCRCVCMCVNRYSPLVMKVQGPVFDLPSFSNKVRCKLAGLVPKYHEIWEEKDALTTPCVWKTKPAMMKSGFLPLGVRKEKKTTKMEIRWCCSFVYDFWISSCFRPGKIESCWRKKTKSKLLRIVLFFFPHPLFHKRKERGEGRKERKKSPNVFFVWRKKKSFYFIQKIKIKRAIDKKKSVLTTKNKRDPKSQSIHTPTALPDLHPPTCLRLLL